MGITPVNYVIYAGQDFSDDITIMINGVPVSFTTEVPPVSFLFTAKTNINLPDDDESVLSFNWSPPDLLVGGLPSGVMFLQLTNAQINFMLAESLDLVATNAVIPPASPFNWYYDVKMVCPGPVVSIIQWGVITIGQPVTTRVI